MHKKVQISVLITFLMMITVNALANILPINGIGTGEVSDAYLNLFAPAGLTFSIWGVIYLALALYTLYQLGLFNQDQEHNGKWLNHVGIIFSISSLINTLWIFAWHYDQIALSFILMILLFVSLLTINRVLKKSTLSKRDRLFVQVPFSIYFGWITVATIANTTTLLVSLGWQGWGISEALWAAIIIAVGAVIGIVTILKNKDYIYGWVILWAYAGILIKHLSGSGFASAYPTVYITVIIALVLVGAADVFTIVTKQKSERKLQ